MTATSREDASQAPATLQTLTVGEWDRDKKEASVLLKTESSATSRLSDASDSGPEDAQETKQTETIPLEEELKAKFDHLYQEHKLLDAARLLRESVEDLTTLPQEYKDILAVAEDVEKAILDITGPVDPSSGWEKRGERQGKWPTLLYNKLTGDEGEFSCRIETPIEASLLVPVLATLSETDIYDTWMPHFRRPFKIGLRHSEQRHKELKANQIIQLIFDLPWPLPNLEVILKTDAVDDIDRNKDIVVRLTTSNYGGPNVPELAEGCERVDFDGAIMLTACPPDHEALKSQLIETDEPLILLTFKM